MWVVLYLLVGGKQIPCPLQRPSIRLGGQVETTWTLPVSDISEIQPRPLEIVDRDVRTMSATMAVVSARRWFQQGETARVLTGLRKSMCNQCLTCYEVSPPEIKNIEHNESKYNERRRVACPFCRRRKRKRGRCAEFSAASQQYLGCFSQAVQ